MSSKFMLLSICTALSMNQAMAQQAGDRVYSANQASNTVSVLDPVTQTNLGEIKLGDQVPAAIGALYKGELLVHGLGFSPDGKTLAVVSIGSNTVTLIDTNTNAIKGKIRMGRSPHEAFFTPNGKELWVAVRGEDYIAVIDPVKMTETRRIALKDGPGMVLFNPKLPYAYVPSSFTPELSVIDTRTYQVIARVPQVSPFSPNLAVSADGSQVWFTLKDTGRVQVMSAKPPFQITSTIDTGPITNHVALIDSPKGQYAYVTVGGANVVKVYTREAMPKLVTTIPTGNLPHGAWASPDGKRVYVGLEGADQVQIIDTATNTIVGSMPTGQLPQAVVYVPSAVTSGLGTQNLQKLDETKRTLVLRLTSSGSAAANISINPLGLVDLLQVAATGLMPKTDYILRLTSSNGEVQDLAALKTTPQGNVIAQTLGPIRQVLQGSGSANKGTLSIVLKNDNKPVLVQTP